MANEQSLGVLRPFRTLYGLGTVGEMTDAQLLERFSSRRDAGSEIAFQTLVERHGPMVLRVCREVLGNLHDAQDAFQATFLVLARKATSIGQPESLGRWLYGVAYRVALKARTSASRRHGREQELVPRSASEFVRDKDHEDLLLTLHEEINQLPEKHRALVVLCYLEGTTYERAARDLGLTEATVRGRLARARNLLRTRLARRGLAVAMGALATWSRTASAAVPSVVVCATSRAAMHLLAGDVAISSTVITLVEGVLKSMLITKLRTAAAASIAFGLIAVGLSVLGLRPGTVQGQSPTQAVEVDDEPPASEGLTLDMAVDRMLRENRDLRSKFAEIPQARADILVAPLRALPGAYADGQLIPYGKFHRSRPGDLVQYDINITYPLNVSAKRQARTEIAGGAKQVLEAQYQDAVRLQIDEVYTAFVDVLAARQFLKRAREGVKAIERLEADDTARAESGASAQTDMGLIERRRNTARLGLQEAAERCKKSEHALGLLLAMSPDEAEMLPLRDTMFDRESPLPPLRLLNQVALAGRSDVVSCRLATKRAEADVNLAEAIGLGDVYLLTQPYAFQNTSDGLKSSALTAVNVTIPLPIYNRTQGAIKRSKLNVTQSRIQLASLERQVSSDVEQAHRECRLTSSAVREFEHDVLPSARHAIQTALRRYSEGKLTARAVLEAQQDYDNVVREYLEILVRRRRSQLVLNTAVGQRILP